jgi:hypothetical protein
MRSCFKWASKISVMEVIIISLVVVSLIMIHMHVVTMHKSAILMNAKACQTLSEVAVWMAAGDRPTHTTTINHRKYLYVQGML